MRFLIRLCEAAAVFCIVAASAAAQTPMRRVHPVAAESIASLSWTSLASDPKGDGLQPRLPDAKELLYAIDAKDDLLWFRVNVWESLPERWFGISVAVDSDAAADNGMTWWGTNKAKFDRLALAFLFKADDDWQGYLGAGESDSIGRGNMTNLTTSVKVSIDRDGRAIFLGVPRTVFGTVPAVRVLATVGSMLANNDDVPNEGMVMVRLKP
jgi:hypothetical protein